MATTDYEIKVQRPLAEYAWKLKVKYKQTQGLSRAQFLNLYDLGEIALSTVFENLFVATRNSIGFATTKVSESCRDFSTGGDMKIGVLKKDKYQRRFVIANVVNKTGTIYFVGWNWITEKPVFFVLPTDTNGNHPRRGYKIMVHPKTGEKTRGWYNDNCSVDTWEDLCCYD